MKLVRDVLDKKLIDSDGCEMGRVDGIVLELPSNAPPRMVRLEMGGEILAERVGHWLVRPVRWLSSRFSPRHERIVTIEWSRVKRMGRDLHLDMRADDTEALAWEHWLAEKFIGRIPGGR
jgi:sporulation protein YlmC with PRC-barrel domain